MKLFYNRILLAACILTCVLSVTCGEDFTHVVLRDHQMSQRCTKTSTFCRIESYRDSQGETHVDVNCFCPFNPEDVSNFLDDLLGHPCPLFPMTAEQAVTYVTFNVTNCFVAKQTVPQSLMRALKRSKHLIIWIEGAQEFRLPVYNPHQEHTKQLTIAMKIIDSSISGIGQGLVSGTDRLRLEAVNSNLSIIDSGAFSSYDRKISDVAINITDCDIYKFAKNSVQLPLSGRMMLERVRVHAIDGGAIAGSGEVSMKDVKIGAIHTGAVNIADMVTFKMDHNHVGQAFQHSVRYQRDSKSEETFADCHFIVIDTQLMSVHGETFVEVCNAAQLTWDNNLIMDIINGPLVLETDDCHMAPSSVITPSRINCANCSSLVLPLNNNLICPVYGSAWCSYCKGLQCTKPVSSFIASECVYGRQTARELSELCKEFSPRSPRHQRLGSGSGGIDVSSYLAILTAVNVIYHSLIRTEL